jgi:predicted lipid-binding transport protein (Tim44 family)
MTWQRSRRARSEERAARLLHAAERDAELAAVRYRELRAAAAAPATEGGAPRGPLPSWQQLLLLVIGGGLLMGLLVMWLLAAAYVGPAAMLVLPVTAGLVAGFIVLRRRHQPPPNPRRHRPLVGDLVRAAQEMQDAEAALQRLRDAHDGTEAPAPEPPPPAVAPQPRAPWGTPRSRAPQT